MRCLVVSLALAALVACGPTVELDGDGDGGGDGGSGATSSATGAEATSVGTAGPTTAGPTTAPPSTTSLDSTGPVDPDTGDDTGPSICPQSTETVVASFSVEPDVDTAATCLVLAVAGAPPMMQIELDCVGTPTTVSLASSASAGPPSLYEGQMVALDYVTDPIFWTNRWLAITSADGLTDFLLVGAVEGSALDPPGTTLDVFFGAAMGGPSVSPVTGQCVPVEDGCGPYERIALDFSLDIGATVTVFDNSVDIIDVLAYGYSFAVAIASRYPDGATCRDVPNEWYQFVAIWFPSD